MNRRDFVAGCSAIGASMGLGSVVNLLAGQPQGDLEKLRGLGRERFRSLLNESLRVYDRFWNQHEVVLKSVKDGPEDPRLDQFVLEFRKESAAPLREGVYVFHHAAVGEFPLFVSPADETGGAFSAVFSRLSA
jgi:hypothetical protein